MAKRKERVAPPPAPEVTSGGRIWYCIDDEKRTVWMTDCSVGHPKATE